MSLATRVSAFFLAALGITLLGFSVVLYALADHHLHRQLDDRLESALATLEAAVDVEHDGLEWEPTERRLTLGLEPGVEQVHWSVQDEHGHMIDHSANIGHDSGHFPMSWKPNRWPTQPTDGTVFDANPGWRLAARRLLLEDLLQHGRGHPEDDGPEDDIEYPILVITAGISPTPVEASLNQLGLTLAGLSASLWLVAAMLGRKLCRHALAPLGAMASAARGMIVAGHGEFLPAPGTRDELDDLRVAFNELLARLHETHERQKRFTGDASHQLRTPLAGLLSLVEVIRRRPRPTAEYEQTLDQVHQETLRLSQIVESLLFLARAEADAESPKAEVVDLAAWVPAQMTRWMDHPRAADIREEGPNNPLPILAQPSLLAQMLENLLDNALKYSEPGDPVLIRTWRESDAVFLAVEDRGVGLAEDEREKVFDPFYRSPQARRMGRTGVGLGLSMVKRISLAFGGSIDVESTPGRGSRFVLRFPARPDLPAPPESEKARSLRNQIEAETIAARAS
ncbi:Signal transduction histidine kinase [Singulisphaera sp. GP187]|uniref:sensor histidine kinase n=1 Tax=Singulisphaera sp. GP187 TaxID=1882752 RepID=UPI000925DACA|nr:HAMP domain-containing sensor histidine kinase [Singulisphaera sp. GP187]SIO46657.1 Signal transduction histidine kinase [Singulisphaera sp. GP187]